MSNEDLPSINDIVEENNLPSYKDFIDEKELPSVEDYITESPKEEVLVEEIENIDPVLSETAPEWSELIRLVNDLRKEIPEIPEIKYYDEELSNLSSKLTHIEEYFTQFDQKSNKIDDLDVKNEHLEEKLTEIESKIPEIPTIRYYDHDIEHINDKITQLKEDITSLPEIKHYDSDISSLVEELNKVKSRDVPDFRWIGNTFNTIDEDFTRVQGHLDVIKEKISFEVSELNETIQVKDFEQNINVKNLKDNVSEKIDQTNTRLTETKDKIYSELSKSSLKVWEYHREFKDDDRKLKKAVLSEQNKIKQKLEKEITSINEQSIKTDETLLKFFNELKEQVNLLPEVKYYDNEISTIIKDVDSLKSTVRELKDIASLIKKDQKQLQENYLLNEPPSEKEKAGGQTDALTPLDQKFATLDDLSNHYRLFINRITTQLSTMGGGGAGFIKDLDDVDITGLQNNYILKWDDPNNKWIVASGGNVGAGGTWHTDSIGISTNKFVGINTTSAVTGKSLYVDGDVQFTGNLSVGGTITKEDIKNLDSIGIITARSGITVTSNGLNVSGISTISTGVGTVHIGVGQTALLVDGDARVTGILTVGRGSITLDPTKKTLTGIDDILVGSGVSISLAPFLGNKGKFVIDRSTINLKGYGSNLDGAYNRQSTSFVLTGAPSYSGSAFFSNISGYYYFLHESDNSKIIIYNLVDGYWSAIYSNGSNFSSPSNGQNINPVTQQRFINPIRTTFDGTGRLYPAAVAGIEYETTVVGQTSILGISTATKMHVGVDTGFHSEELVVTGDARVTGILTIGTGSITLDPNERKISGIDEIIIGTATTVRIHQDTSGEVVFSNRDGKQASVGIGTTVSINTTGIITAATLKATTAFYPPIYTTTQRDAGSFSEGAIIFNTTSKKLEFYDGTSWNTLPGLTVGLSLALDG